MAERETDVAKSIARTSLVRFVMKADLEFENVTFSRKPYRIDIMDASSRPSVQI